MKLIDAHTHVQLRQFNPDRDEVIKRAVEQDIWMVNVGTTRKDSQAAVDLCEAYAEGVFASIGQHPDEREIFDYDWYMRTGAHEKVVAIGECGLDYYRVEPHLFNDERDRQIELFQQHIELAKELGKPLMVHCREAFSDVKSVMRKEIGDLSADVPGILHFFTGTKEDAKTFLDFGFISLDESDQVIYSSEAVESLLGVTPSKLNTLREQVLLISNEFVKEIEDFFNKTSRFLLVSNS
ncbi:MAG: Hydrolase, TatD family, partial [Candidatus Wolfebacteria bacterium GW2011_GWE2_47_12]